MITQARIDQELASVEGLDWISALRAPSIAGLVEGGALQLSLFDRCDLAEISSPEFPGERLIVCKNPLLAEERARKRLDLLAATEAALARIGAATQRPGGRSAARTKSPCGWAKCSAATRWESTFASRSATAPSATPAMRTRSGAKPRSTGSMSFARAS